MSEKERKINVSFQEKISSILIDGNKLLKSTLYNIYQIDKGVLSCMVNGTKCFLQTDHLHFLLNEKINDYVFSIPESKYYF